MKMEILVLKNFCQTMPFKVCLMTMMEPMEDRHTIMVKDDTIYTYLTLKWMVTSKFIQISFMKCMNTPNFICGNGVEVPFYWVNDEYADCEDGADEQWYDSNTPNDTSDDCQEWNDVIV